MESNEKNKKRRLLFNRVANCVCVLTICVFPLLLAAGQNPAGESAPAVQQPATTPAPEQTSQAAPPSNPSVPPQLLVPAGTVITVRVSEWLSSDRNRPGDLFRAELEQPLVVDGWVVSRRGQTVMGRVTVARKAGVIRGTSQLGVELSELVLVDGHQSLLETQLLQSSAGTSRGRDATAIGTTTGVGAVIGGTAGEGKGAAIGAGAGAAAGVIGVMLTRGRPTEISPEALLTFRLETPLTVSTERSRAAFRPVTPEDYGSEGLVHRPKRIGATYPSYPPPVYYPYSYGYGYYPPPAFWGFYGFYSHRFGHDGFWR